MGLLRDLKVELVVTCFQEHPEKKGGAVPLGAYVYQFGIAGKKRNASWEGLRKLILPALENGESIYVHCMAGVHRAPVAAALILAAVRQLPFDRMMQHIQKLRAVEPHKMIKGDVGEWVYTANIGPLPGPQVKIPVPFVTSKVDGSLMHAVPKDWDPDSPAPACRWRQSKTGSRGFYSGNIEYVDDVFAAIAYNRPFCQSCALMCPPGVQQVLWENSSPWSRQWNCPDLSRIRVCIDPAVEKEKQLQGQPGSWTAVHPPTHNFECFVYMTLGFSLSRCTL